MLPDKKTYYARLKKLCGIGLFWLITAGAIFGQHYLVRRYSEPDGLPSAMVYDIGQDPAGRMWFATRSGLSCWDGLNWKRFTVANGLPSTAAIRLESDHLGRIWVLCGINPETVSVARQEGRKWSKGASLPLPEPMVMNYFPTFVLLPANFPGKLPVAVVGTLSKGLFLANRNGWDNIGKNEGLSGNKINGLLLLGDKLLIATNRGLSLLDRSLAIDNRLNEKFGTAGKEIHALALETLNTGQERIWLYGEGWLGYFDRKTKAFKRVVENLDFHLKDATYKILPDTFSGVYIASAYTVYYYNYRTGERELLTERTGLISEGANSLFMDFEKNIWLSCGRGVTKIISRRFTNYNLSHGMLENEVTSILEYDTGKFILGHNEGFSLFDGKRFRLFPLESAYRTVLAPHRVLDMAKDPENNVWMAFSGAGLFKVDVMSRNPVMKHIEPSTGMSSQADCVYVEKNGTVWAGGDFIYKGDGKRFARVKIGDETKLKTRRIYGKNGKVRYIAGQSSGFYVRDEKTEKWTNYHLYGKRGANSIFSIHDNGDGTLMLGTLVGLYCLENRSMLKFIRYGFSIDRPVFFIFKDRRGRFWFGTDNGIIRWDGKEVKLFQPALGLSGQEANRTAVWEDRRGRIWLGTNRGLSIYNDVYDVSTGDVRPPKLDLLPMDASGLRIPLTAPVELSYEQNNVTFFFRGISFMDERAIRFKTRLAGMEEKWSEESYPYGQSIRYSNVSPGTYRFQVKARNSLGTWSEVKTSPEITILNPIHRRWWFYSLMGLASLFLLYMIFKWAADKQHAARLETEVKQRTSELHAVEKRYRTLFEDTKDVVFITEPGGRIIDINPAGVELFGYGSKEEMIETVSSEQLYREVRDRDAYRSELIKNGFVKDYQVNFQDRNGDLVTGEVTASVVRDENDDIIAFRGIVRDVTEKSMLEQQLLQAQKMEAIGTLAGGIAHDFNNILGVIIGYAEMVLEDLPKSGDVYKNVDQIMIAAQRATDLVRQILAFSRRSESKRKPLVLAEAIRESLKLIRSSLPATIEIRTNLEDENAKIFGDPTQLNQVLMNLCTNAAHAMEENGGILEVKMNSVYFDETATMGYNDLEPGPYVALSVSDTGHGIPQLVIKRIFDPFFTTKKTGEGTGMGLAMIHGIVKSYRGDISVFSEPGKGTTFHIFFPQIEEQPEPVPQDPAGVPGGTERILLVDDEEVLAQVSKKMLERLGYDVVGITDPVEAFHIFQKKPDAFDLMISDLTMPKMTGIQLAEKVKELNDEIPVIICSGFSSTVNKEKFASTAVDKFVMKPMIKAEIGKVIRELLEL